MKNTTARKLREVPEGFVIVGVDPHKKRHAVVIMTRDAVVRTRFKVSNSRRGYDELLRRVGWCVEGVGGGGAIFAIESASHYWRNLAYFLEEHGLAFRLINPFSLKRRREGRDMDRRKSDYRDAEAAAEMLRQGEFTETKLPQGVYAELRGAYSCYRRLVKERTRLINLLKGLLDGLFPEFTEVFRCLWGHTALRVLEVCPIPRVIAGMTRDQFVDVVRGGDRKMRLMVGKLKALQDVAKGSIGVAVAAGVVAEEVSLLTQRLRMINGQIGATQKRLVDLVDSVESSKYLLSIVGIGYITVAGMLAELGPLEGYKNGKQLIKMAGTNPTQSESAGKQSRRTPMSKKGRGGLRECGWKGVASLMRHNADFRTWGKERLERPAHAHPLEKREVMGAMVNRLLRISQALVRKRTYYRMPEAALRAT